jgi:hypothetical protein
VQQRSKRSRMSNEKRKESSLEECRLLGYKNIVRTSQETHHVSTTELSQLTLCEI